MPKKDIHAAAAAAAADDDDDDNRLRNTIIQV